MEHHNSLLRTGVDQLVYKTHEAAKNAGWWKYSNGENIIQPLPIIEMFQWLVATKLALIHSEISEALEGFRKNLQSDHLANRSMMEEELADALIRIGDLAGFLGFHDLGQVVVDKMNYNESRKDHKFDERQKENGKKF